MNKLDIIQFGDFQTPKELALLMCNIVRKYQFNPKTIVEPTCGAGNILITAQSAFPEADNFYGIEINPEYLNALKENMDMENVHLFNQNIFSFDWNSIEDTMPDPVLFIGNPPWVTNSGLGMIDRNNTPEKTNFKGLRGIEAITGKSNFDIAEYIIINLVERFIARQAVFSFLCKTSVARSIFQYISIKKLPVRFCEMYRIDSKKYFNVDVDACLFNIIVSETAEDDLKCSVYKSLESNEIVSVLGFSKNMLINNLTLFEKYSGLIGKSHYIWRNGIKHDNSKVMELEQINGSYVNGNNETLDIEPELIYPLLKSSDISKPDYFIRKFVIVTQKAVGQDTACILSHSPKTWRYLNENRETFLSRKSSIYKNKPDFSIFSVGAYTFAPWKIAISGLYKKIKFSIIGSLGDKPILVDDTCNFIPCNTEEEAIFIVDLLESEPVITLLNSLIFWDSKRPITTGILNSIDLEKVAVFLDKEDLFIFYLHHNNYVKEVNNQPMLEFNY